MQAVTYNYVIFLEIFEAGYKSRLFYVLQKVCLVLKTKQINRFFSGQYLKMVIKSKFVICLYLTLSLPLKNATNIK